MKMVKMSTESIAAKEKTNPQELKKLSIAIRKFRASPPQKLNALVANKLEGLLLAAEVHPSKKVRTALLMAVKTTLPRMHGE